MGLKSHGTRLCPLHKKLDQALAQTEAAFASTTLGRRAGRAEREHPLVRLSAAAEGNGHHEKTTAKNRRGFSLIRSAARTFVRVELSPAGTYTNVLGRRRPKQGRGAFLGFTEIDACLTPWQSSARPAPWARSFARCWPSASSPSSRSSSWPPAGRPARRIRFAGREYTVEELTPSAFDGVDLAIGSTPDEVARDFVPWAVERGCVVVDESGYWRMDPKVPLVIPEVNPEAVEHHQGIIASPNCSTTQMVVAMKPLHDAARIRRVIVSTYQATSGAGVAGSATWSTARTAALAGEPYQYETFAHPIAFNLIPQIGSHQARRATPRKR